MYIWVSQERFSSRNARTVERTRYLENDRGVIEKAIRSYFREDPRGEQVTLAGLDALGEDRVHELTRLHHKSVDTIKQDIGLFVAIVLGELYKPAGIETYRDERTMRNATRARSPRWTGLTWVSKYTPHRLASRQDSLGRMK
jgi:hypothetical protein